MDTEISPTPTNTYLDHSGRPQLRESITAFLDVLGFSHTVVAAAEAGQSDECLSNIVHAIEDAKAFVRASLSHHAYADPRHWAIKFFSDNLLIGYPVEDPSNVAAAATFVLLCTQRYQLRMALSGFFVRGALTLGPLCVTDDIIFGTALIESYRLESNASIVPRVVVTEPVMQAATSYVAPTADPESRSDSDLLCRDIDGWWFVNYLQSAVEPHGVNWQLIEQHKHAVLASLSRSARHDILPKFGWVSRYHNVFCHWHRNSPGYSDEYRIQRVDEESAIERVGSSKGGSQE